MHRAPTSTVHDGSVTTAADDGRALVVGVTASSARRGAEVFAVDLAAALMDTFAVTTVALAPGAGSSIDVPILGDRRLALSTLRSLRRVAAPSSAVIAHGSTALPACAIGLTGVRVPFVYRSIGDPQHWSTATMRRIRVRWYL